MLWFMDKRCVFGILTPRTATMLSFSLRWPNFSCAFFWVTEILKLAAEVSGNRSSVLKKGMNYVYLHLGLLFFNVVASIMTVSLLMSINRMWVLSVHLLVIEIMRTAILVVTASWLWNVIRTFKAVKSGLSKSLRKQHMNARKKLKQVLAFDIAIFLVIGLLIGSYARDSKRTWLSTYPEDVNVYDPDFTGAFGTSIAYVIASCMMISIGWIPFSRSEEIQESVTERSAASSTRKRSASGTASNATRTSGSPDDLVKIELFPNLNGLKFNTTSNNEH
jgi:hypothetical protein